MMAALSRYMAEAKDRGLPPDVVEKAKHHILDTFAAMVSGSGAASGRAEGGFMGLSCLETMGVTASWHRPV